MGDRVIVNSMEEPIKTPQEIKLRCLELAMKEWGTSFNSKKGKSVQEILAIADTLYNYCTGEKPLPFSYKIN